MNRLQLPTIDDRSYRQILDEALARIPVHNPEWRNFNDSDPGITLVQLFAFMTESLLYRANRIPERNRLKFLQLLGIPLQPAAAAQGIVSFSNPRGPSQAFTLEEDLEVQAGRLPFRTQNGLDVLPLEARVYYKSPLPQERKAEVEALYRQLYASFESQDAQLAFYEARPLQAPSSGAAFPSLNLADQGQVLDGALWVALLIRNGDSLRQARSAAGGKTITLGVLPALGEASRILQPGGPDPASAQASLTFEIPIPESLPQQASQRVPRYLPLPARFSGDLLAEPGVVELQLPEQGQLGLWPNLEPLEQGSGDFPPSLEDTDLESRILTWVRIRLAERQGASAQQLRGRLSWVGINAAQVTQRARVLSENLGRASGAPDQEVSLANTPVISDSVQLLVNGEVWQRVEDLTAAASEVPVGSPRLLPGAAPLESEPQPSRVYSLDRDSGTIRFGNGLHGARPPAGALMQASYDYGGGRQGNVGIGAINKSAALPSGLRVANPIPCFGGAEQESVAEAERRIPQFLRHRGRLVSAADFKEIALSTPGVDMGRVEVLPLFHPGNPDGLSQGVVTVMVIPRFDVRRPAAPQPDQLFLDTVCEYLAPRRLITTEIHLRGPEYVPLLVSVGFEAVAGQDVAPVRQAVEEAIRQFLSPLTGGRQESGWPLEKPVERLELWAVAARVDGVAQVNDLLLGDRDGAASDRIELTGLEVPRLEGISVQSGSPQSLDSLRGEAVIAVAAEPRVVPVPVIAAEC